MVTQSSNTSKNRFIYDLYKRASGAKPYEKLCQCCHMSYAINYALIKSNNGNLMDHIRKAPSHSLTLSAILRRAVRNLRRRRFPMGFFGKSVEMETVSSDVCILESCVEPTQGYLCVYMYTCVCALHLRATCEMGADSCI